MKLGRKGPAKHNPTFLLRPFMQHPFTEHVLNMSSTTDNKMNQTKSQPSKNTRFTVGYIGKWRKRGVNWTWHTLPLPPSRRVYSGPWSRFLRISSSTEQSYIISKITIDIDGIKLRRNVIVETPDPKGSLHNFSIATQQTKTTTNLAA